MNRSGLFGKTILVNLHSILLFEHVLKCVAHRIRQHIQKILSLSFWLRELNFHLLFLQLLVHALQGIVLVEELPGLLELDECNLQFALLDLAPKNRVHVVVELHAKWYVTQLFVIVQGRFVLEKLINVQHIRNPYLAFLLNFQHENLLS